MTPLRLERAISLLPPLSWVLITPTPPKGHKRGCASAYRPALCVRVCVCMHTLRIEHLPEHCHHNSS